jgi:hypothetical protein
MERITYEGWPDCIRLTNGSIEIVVTTVIGPRVIHCGFVGGQNLFGVLPEMKGLIGGDEWRIYGGHRLWHSPENMPRSYSPDNSPIHAKPVGGWLQLTQAVEPATGIQKEIRIRVDSGLDRVDVIHNLTNHNAWDVELAPWALSVMAQGGECICPQTPGDFSSLIPNRRVTLWPYTNMGDPRLTWGEKYIRMRQDRTRPRKCKYGISAEDGWVCYLLDGEMFLKRFDYDDEEEYPDYGCSVEVFTNEAFLEMETLGPLSLLAPGETTEHEERWYLFRGVTVDDTEASIDRAVLSKVERTE